MNGGDKKMIEEIFKPMDETLAKFQRSFSGMETDIAVIKNEQVHQGDYIEALQGDVRGLHDKVDRMPDTWRMEIGEAIKGCRSQRDAVTSAAKEVEEGLKGEITKVTDLAKERERAKRDRKVSIIPASTRNLFVKLLPFILYGLAILGAYTMTKLGSPDAADLARAVDAIERVEAKVDGMNGKKEEAGEGN